MLRHAFGLPRSAFDRVRVIAARISVIADTGAVITTSAVITSS